ncbi:translocation/assembly module TamB domain-containing protein [Gemmatimonas sp.]|uniref:translocation/assembly module TamB domain-containing protein n=1 Tax=Gemmatimonas sp. TaxID=1962908 RepID=UPI003983292F
MTTPDTSADTDGSPGMSSRQRRFWWAAGTILGAIGGLGISYYLAVNTESGRRWLLSAAISGANGLFGGRGTLRVGILRSISPTHIVADNVSLVDTAGVPVVTAQHLEGSIEISGVFNKVIHIRTLAVRGLRLDLERDEKGPWNIAYIISGDTTKKTPRSTPGFGDDIRIDSLIVDGGRVGMIAPWAPHPIFTGTARDSVIAVKDSLHDIVRAPNGTYFERRLVVLERVRAHDAIIVDVEKRPASMQLDTLSGVISDPPIRIAQAAGAIRWTGDSLQLNLRDVKLPASTGTAVGTIDWHNPGPLRYDVVIKTDAGLTDLQWIWDVLPADGRGSAIVRMRTLENPDDVEFALTALDVKSGASRITGGIDIVLQPAQMRLQRVDLAFVPLHSDLLRRISYDALPPEIRGTFTGKLVARDGGPLTAFKMDLLDARFADALVPGGAVSTAKLRGMVAIGERPRAWGMTLDDARVDLRSVRALSPALIPVVPAVDGMLTARGVIRSADLDGADLTNVGLMWTDAVGNISVIRGDVRARYGGANAKAPLVNAVLQLDPLSMRALARIDTTLPIRGAIAGRVTMDGRTDAMRWTAALRASDGSGVVAPNNTNASGSAVTMQGTAALTASTWQLTADGALNQFDVRQWIGRPDVPSTAVDGTVTLSARGPRSANGVNATDNASRSLFEGNMVADWKQLAADDRPAFDLSGSVSLGAERLLVDSATAHIGGVTFDARGALARDSLKVDTLTLSARADSLGAVRAQLDRLASMMQSVDSSTATSLRKLAADTLEGDLSLSGYLYGSLTDAGATAAIGARAMQVGSVRVGRVFGSAKADHVFTRPAFEGAATADDIDGLGAIRLQTVGFRVQKANADSGLLALDVSSQSEAHLFARGVYTRAPSRFAVALDSLRLAYADVVWRSAKPIMLEQDSVGFRLFPVELRSNVAGVLSASANVPSSSAITGSVRLEQFPVGELAALLAGTPTFAGTLSGTAELTGTRPSPLLSWALRGDSLGINRFRLPSINSTGQYADRTLVVTALLTDSLGGALRAEARVPVDLAIASVDKRMLSDQVDAKITADSLRLEGLPLAIDGVQRLRGRVSGQLALSGNMDRPVARGSMTAEGVGAFFRDLNIEPSDGRIVLRAAEDSLILETLRIRSGDVLDTIGASGALHFHVGEPSTVSLKVSANNAELSRQRDGTDLDLSANVTLVGPLRRPTLSGAIFVPRANLVFDPLGARNALDLSSEAARELLGAEEVPVAETAAQSLAALGSFLNVENARVDLGNEVWVQTPEARVKVSGGLSVAMSGDRLALEGELNANRGQYRLDLGVVSRSFSVDSGRVRFFGSSAIAPTLDISATNTVRVAAGSAIPVRVHIGGTYDVPVLTLSSSDPLYASAPESEIISLLIFGAPTFALDGAGQSTVRAVTGVLLPTVGGAVEGALQKFFPGINTIQVTNAGGQSQQDLSALSLLDNLSISAGKQLGERTFLRANTGVCRGGAASSRSSLWIGLAAEYRISRNLSGQIGMDPGSAPCTQLGTNGLPRLQFGFDLFREWIF